MASGAKLLSNPSDRLLLSILALVWNELMAWRQKMIDSASSTRPTSLKPPLSTVGDVAVNELSPSKPVATEPSVTEVWSHFRKVRWNNSGALAVEGEGGGTHLVRKVNLGVNRSHLSLLTWVWEVDSVWG
ncbi:hypothetical protein BASA81_002259 [Batrachochytrium salamandrivorans]|nr:hypothetical protein BASA81_002259 [Batrachochytrium salamandrivorans]